MYKYINRSQALFCDLIRTKKGEVCRKNIDVLSEQKKIKNKNKVSTPSEIMVLPKRGWFFFYSFHTGLSFVRVTRKDQAMDASTQPDIASLSFTPIFPLLPHPFAPYDEPLSNCKLSKKPDRNGLFEPNFLLYMLTQLNIHESLDQRGVFQRKKNKNK